jgi:transposase
MGNKSRRAYPPEFRQQIVELYNAGRSSTELAQDFGASAQSIRNWVGWAKRAARAAADQEGKASLTPSEHEELERLRRENRQLRLEREILSKAAAWFARETSRIPSQDSDS